MGNLIETHAAKQRMRRIWGMGDYSHLSKRLEPAAGELADACAVSAGQECSTWRPAMATSRSPARAKGRA